MKGRVAAGCRAVAVIPARNEAGSLPDALDALAIQEDVRSNRLRMGEFEILLFLNNCTDDSSRVARLWKAAHPEMVLHILERALSPATAHVGTARRLLMDTAWARLQGAGERAGILSTDADTVVAPDWVAQNLFALALGADAVGGVIELKLGELERLPKGARTAYLLDREYQRLGAELEDLLDPQPGDPWPRHLEHFGASLACTPATYARAGGLPPVKSLEDMALVDALYRIDARVRHEPAVRVYTSARLDGRASVGLSWQLRKWQETYDAGKPHQVPSAAWLQHRFRCRRFLRELYRSSGMVTLQHLDEVWQGRLRRALAQEPTVGGLLAHADCHAWILNTFRGGAQDEIASVIRSLRSIIETERVRAQREGATRPREIDSCSFAARMSTRAATDRRDNAQLDAR